MGYKIGIIKENIVSLDLFDNFTAEDTVNHVIEMDPLLDRLSKSGNQVQFLVRTAHLKKISLEGRRSFSERNGDPRVGLTAVIGVNRFLKIIAQFITIASGKNNIRFFDESDESKAIDWLLESSK